MDDHHLQGVPRESESGRPSDEIERDVGTAAWDVHARPQDDALQVVEQQPVAELSAESPKPGDHDDPSDSG